MGQIDIYIQKDELGSCFTPNENLTQNNQELKFRKELENGGGEGEETGYFQNFVLASGFLDSTPTKQE